VLIVTVSTDPSWSEWIFGCIGCERIAPVNEYLLVESGIAGAAGVTTLPDYSRWTEPACGLLARLVSRHPRNPRAEEAGAYLSCTVYFGRKLDTARRIEHLDARIVGATLHASLADEFEVRRIEIAARKHYAHPLDLLEHAARVAVWGADEEPPVPPPLTGVPIHDDGGQPYVLAKDIPTYPRRYFEERHVRCTTPPHDAYFAHDWYLFIGGR